MSVRNAFHAELVEGIQELDDLAASVPVVLVGRRLTTDSVDVVRTADDKGVASSPITLSG
jgi:hypothetical protein